MSYNYHIIKVLYSITIISLRLCTSLYRGKYSLKNMEEKRENKVNRLTEPDHPERVDGHSMTSTSGYSTGITVIGDFHKRLFHWDNRYQ